MAHKEHLRVWFSDNITPYYYCHYSLIHLQQSII